MAAERPETIAARVPTRTRRLAEAAAQARGVTLSRFTSDAIHRVAREELLEEPEDAAGTAGGGPARAAGPSDPATTSGGTP